MKKCVYYILTFLSLFLIYFVNVNAQNNYIDVSQYDFYNNPEDLNLNLSGYGIGYGDIISTSDGGILINAEYVEDKEYIDGVRSDGSIIKDATHLSDHAKLIKLDASYNKVWESNFYVLGNWSNPDPKAPTVGTTFNNVVELSDGSFVGAGYTFGLVRNNDPYRFDDDFDAIIVRFDKNGNELYRYSYYDEGIDQAIIVKALENNYYVVKYYYVPTKIINGQKKPTEFSTNLNDDYYYIVYNDNNEIIETISESEKTKLNDLNFINEYDKQDLELKVNSTIEIISKKYYMGVDSEGDIIYNEIKKDNNEWQSFINIYDFYTLKLKKSIKILSSKMSISSPKSFLMCNNGNFMVNGNLYNKDGKLVSDNSNDNFLKNKRSFTTKNGDIIIIDNKTVDKNSSYLDNDTLKVIKASESKSDFADFVIDGVKISRNLGVFLENDRTYINMNNLCSVMGCTFSRSEKNNNKIIIEFDALRGNKMINNSESMNGSLNNKIKFIVTHEIGSKKYSTYLAVQPYKIFYLKNPIFNADSVDVSSKEIEGQIYVPLRFISEALGRYVDYNPEGENNKPVITIGSFGEGEFYEKYKTAISYDNFKNDDVINNIIENNSITVEWGLTKLVYGYVFDNNTKKVLNTDKTIFVPVKGSLLMGTKDLEYNEKDDSNLNNHYTYSIFESKDNWIGKQVAFVDDNGKEGEKYTGDGKYQTFILIANVQGFPFIKIVNFN